MNVSVEQLRPIADEVCEWRPDWSHGGVLNVLTEVRDGRRVEEIQEAAIRAAKDPSSRTPSAIAFPMHWQPRRATHSGPFTARPLPECTECGRPAARDAQLVACPACRAPWKPMIFREVQAVRTREEQAAINARGMAKVATAIRDAAPDPAAVEAATGRHCGWCAAGPRQVCRNDYGVAIRGVHRVRTLATADIW